jgi:hypothetical protein
MYVSSSVSFPCLSLQKYPKMFLNNLNTRRIDARDGKLVHFALLSKKVLFGETCLFKLKMFCKDLYDTNDMIQILV